MAKKIALGKGIASLIQETPNEILSQSLKDLDKKEGVKKSDSEMENSPCLIDISTIEANPGQPRKIFKEKETVLVNRHRNVSYQHYNITSRISRGRIRHQ